jgi:hypothetical protein
LREGGESGDAARLVAAAVAAGDGWEGERERVGRCGRRLASRALWVKDADFMELFV